MYFTNLLSLKCLRVPTYEYLVVTNQSFLRCHSCEIQTYVNSKNFSGRIYPEFASYTIVIPLNRIKNMFVNCSVVVGGKYFPKYQVTAWYFAGMLSSHQERTSYGYDNCTVESIIKTRIYCNILVVLEFPSI